MALDRFLPCAVTVALKHEAAVSVAGVITAGTLSATGLASELRWIHTTCLTVRLTWAFGFAITGSGALLLGVVDFIFAAQLKGVCIRVALPISWYAWLRYG
jgi:hypothetical protein